MARSSYSPSPICLVLLLAGCGGGDGGGAAGDDAGAVARPDGGAVDAARADGSTVADGGAVDAPIAPPSDAGPESCERTRPDLSMPVDAPWQVGGGPGYPDILAPDGACTTVVRTRAELEAALADAEPDDVVYVDDDAAIDLSGASLCIPSGVTVASGRGRTGSAGALLYTTTTVREPLLRACGDDVRITGIRLHGADPTQCPPEYPDRCTGVDRTGGVNCRDCMPVSYGISARMVHGLEVDNCDLSGFSAAAISVTASLRNHVHHNYIHHNQRQGLGYGVVLGRHLDPTFVLIEHNRFDYNRHSIAGSGEHTMDYTARYNVVLPHANGHVFDMHGQNENTDDGTPWAGGDIRIHDNTVTPTDQYAVVIRGQPEHGAWMWSNCLARSSAATAFAQRHHFGNFHPDESPSGRAVNLYSRSASDCETLRFCFDPGGAGPQTALAASSYAASAVALGDFDGDGRDDVFRPDGTAWWWLSGGRGGWERLNSSSIGLSSLLLGDFDGDGRTDVFRATGTEWRWSRSGSSPWAVLRAATETIDALRFGDFDGDGRTDALRADGTAWWVSDGASSAWARVNTSSVPIDRLAVGDFDGDGRDDVFDATGSEWRWSRSASGPWMRLNVSGATLGSLALADVDGNGRTAVVRVAADRRQVSYAGASRWTELAHASEPLGELRFGDLDGDGRDDVFRARCF